MIGILAVLVPFAIVGLIGNSPGTDISFVPALVIKLAYLLAIGITFISGANITMLYDTLQELGREDEYPRYRGKLQAVQLSSVALSSAELTSEASRAALELPSQLLAAVGTSMTTRTSGKHCHHFLR